MNQKETTKKMPISCMATSWKILTIAGIAILASSVYFGDAQAQSFTDSI
ncbi:hypothetical protein [Tychonema sp. BBK16]|nr:hypothetical protein [Tychonema sp. BBK16]MCF6372000.1 hypothetical protein [Tychonema sp. BBK16]